MCKVSVHFQENLPSETEQYKTQHFSVDLEEDLPRNSDLNIAIAQLFTIAKANVQSQINQAKSEKVLSQQPTQQAYQPQQLLPPSTGSRNSSKGGQVSQKQLNYLYSLGRKQNYNQGQIEAMLKSTFGVADVYQLSSKNASEFIERMKQ